MANLSHRVSRLSMTACALIALAGAAPASAAMGSSQYLGRWTVSDDNPVFSRRGLQYKTFDVAACGGDFCGVSVGPGGACGATLFRFKAKTMKRKSLLVGHGRWGTAVKNVEISAWSAEGNPGGRGLDLSLGDGHDFGTRSGSMPKFSATYSPVGKARCAAR